MPDVQHASLRPGASSGIHVVQAWEAASATARTALSVGAADIGKVCRQLDDGSYWILTGVSGGATWRRIDNIEVTLSNAAPQPLGTPTPGDDAEPARGDHVHAHGTQAGGTLHALADVNGAGFMSPAHVTKLAAVPATFDAFATDAEVTAAVAPKADRAFNVKWISDDYTLTLADAGALLVAERGGAEHQVWVNVTIPPDEEVAFPVGTVVSFAGLGFTSVVLVPGIIDVVNTVYDELVSVRSTGGSRTRTDGSVISVIKLAPNDWLISGDVGDVS